MRVEKTRVQGYQSFGCEKGSRAGDTAETKEVVGREEEVFAKLMNYIKRAESNKP